MIYQEIGRVQALSTCMWIFFFFTNAAFSTRFDLPAACKQIFRSPKRDLVENPFFCWFLWTKMPFIAA